MLKFFFFRILFRQRPAFVINCYYYSRHQRREKQRLQANPKRWFEFESFIIFYAGFFHIFFLITLHPNSIKFGFKRGEEIGIFNAFFLLKAKKSINPSLPLCIFFLFAGGISTHKNLLKNIFSFSPLSSLRCTGRCKC